MVAISLNKIANDLALMGSGPRAGLAELLLPELQKGSSIMPGKVNPVMPEVTIQVACQVIGNDAAITIAGSQGQFELNVRVPLIARNLLDSIKLLGAASPSAEEKCIDDLEANREMNERHAEATLAAATALNPLHRLRPRRGDRQGGGRLRPHAARGRDREGRRRGDPRQGARLREHGQPTRVAGRRIQRDIPSRMAGGDLAWIHDVYETWNEGEIDRFAEYFAPKAKYATSGLFPGIAPVYTGPDGLRQFYADMLSAFEFFRLEPLELEEQGQVLVVSLRFHGRGRTSGVEVGLDFHHVAVVGNQQIQFIAAGPSLEAALATAAEHGVTPGSVS